MSDQAVTTKLDREFRRSAVTRYKEGKSIISDAELVSCIIPCLAQDGFGLSMDTSALEVVTEVRNYADYRSDIACHPSVSGIAWDKKYIVKNIPGFTGSIVVFASMRHVPPGHFSDKLTSREEFEVWCKEQKNLERRRKNWHKKHPPVPGKSYELPKELFGNLFSTAKPRTGVLVDTLEDTELTTADIMSIVVCYDGLDIGAIRNAFVLRKFVQEAEKRFNVSVDLRARLCLYSSGMSDEAMVFNASTTDAVSTTIRNVFKAGTAVESSIKKYENDITRPITQEYE